MAVDEAHSVISHMQADFADRRDCTLPSIVAPLHQRLTTQGLSLREVAADTNYSNGVNYALLEAQGSTPWNRSSPSISPTLRALVMTQKPTALHAQLTSSFYLSASVPTQMVDSVNATVPPVAIVACARVSTPARRRVRNARLPARPTMPSTAGRSLGSRVA